MFTLKKLLKAYDHATRLPLDSDSKLIFFSDVHRGDNSVSDEFLDRLVMEVLGYDG